MGIRETLRDFRALMNTPALTWEDACDDSYMAECILAECDVPLSSAVVSELMGQLHRRREAELS